MEIRVSCAFGLESAVKGELIALGYKPYSASEGLLGIEGSWLDVYRLNLWLRTANRVLLPLIEGKAESYDSLYDLAYSFHWEDIAPKAAKIDVTRISSSRSLLYSKSDIQSIAKKAICDRMMRAYGINWLEESGSIYPVSIDINNDIASVYLNASGPSLHRRGYSIQRGDAPLKETLASGMLELMRYHGEREVADVMCGSGTIPIEAALIACGLAPGRNRSFAFLEWGVLPKISSEEAKEEMLASQKEPEYRILASDISPKAIHIAQANAERAGVSNIVKFQCIDLRSFRSRKRSGLICINPPYSQRMGSYKETYEICSAIAGMHKLLGSWDLIALSAFDQFQKAFGKKADKNRKIFTGGTRAYMYMYFGDKPQYPPSTE